MRLILSAAACLLAIAGVALSQTAVVPLSGQGLKSVVSTQVGIYWWGGSINGVLQSDMYTQGRAKAETLLSANTSTVVRVLMGPQSAANYIGGACQTAVGSLTALAQSSDWLPTFEDSQFQTILITGYDWTTFGDCVTKNYKSPTFLGVPDNYNAVVAEWQLFATYLGNTYPNKTFILEAWEGDNDCWCGAALIATLASCPSGPTSIEGYTLWMQARAAGIRAAGKLNVKSSIEFNDIDNLEPHDLPSVLYTIVPQVQTDYVSYSFYESKLTTDTFASDIVKIRNAMTDGGHSPSTLIIGELGYSTNNTSHSDQARVVTFINVARAAQIPYVVIWNLFDIQNGVSDLGFGAYDADGNMKPYGMSISAY